MAKIFMQTTGAEHAPMLDMIQPVHEAQASAQGFQYVRRADQPETGRQPKWCRIAAVRATLATMADGDLLVTADADSLWLPKKASVDLASALPDDKEIGMVVYKSIRPGILNNSVMFVRKTAATVKLFDDCWQLGVGPYGQLCDELCLQMAINRTPALKVATLDPKWNSFCCARSPDPVIVGWHGVRPDLALPRMQEAILVA